MLILISHFLWCWNWSQVAQITKGCTIRFARYMLIYSKIFCRLFPAWMKAGLCSTKLYRILVSSSDTALWVTRSSLYIKLGTLYGSCFLLANIYKFFGVISGGSALQRPCPLVLSTSSVRALFKSYCFCNHTGSECSPWHLSSADQHWFSNVNKSMSNLSNISSLLK